jgi:hypothetical protein
VVTTPAAPQLLGTCLGFSVRSDRPLHYLRAGTGSEPLTVTWGSGRPPPDTAAPLLVWDRPAAPFAARLHRVGRRFHLWVEQVGWFTVDTEVGEVGTPPDAACLRTQERVWGLPVLLCLLERGVLPLHAAAVDVGGRAVVLGAPGRGGKTTLAAACARAGLRVLAEDVAAITATGSILPGPAMLRLRHDVVGMLGSVPGRVLGRDDDRVHLALEPPGDGTPLPLGAVVLLRNGGGEGIELGPADPQAALRDLWSLSFNLPTTEDRARCFSALADLVACVPVLDLDRPLRPGSLAATVEAVVAAGQG